jgi:CheY-like chemotaxis protein
MNCVQKVEDRQQGTVLIVDYEPDDLRLTQRVVAAVCPELCIMCVMSGEEMICYLKGENWYSNRSDFPYPFFALLDLRMPGMRGFDVLRWLRDHPPHNMLPVVVLTVSGESVVVQRAYELGARSFLTKPIKPDELREITGRFQEWFKQVQVSALAF